MKKILLKAIFFYLLLLFLIFTFFYSLHIIFEEKLKLIHVQAGIDLSFAILIAIYFYKYKKNPLSIFKKIRFTNTLILVCLIFLFSSIYSFFNVGYLLKSIKNESIYIIPTLNFANFLKYDYYHLIRVLILMPFFEEIFYRYIIQTNLSKKINSTFSIIIASILFTITHLDLENFLPLLGCGIFLGFVYHKTNNISYAILLHFGINLVINLFTYDNYRNTLITGIPILLLFSFLIILLSSKLTLQSK